MKFIGQFIQDFIARFRNDVYLEDISTGTIASGGNLGLDSNNKIVKADTNAGELSITNASDNRVVTSTGGTGLNAESLFTWDGETAEVKSGVSSKAEFNLTNANLDATGSVFNFKKMGLSPANSDIIGTINFNSLNSSSTDFNFVKILSSIKNVSSGSEEATLNMSLATNNALRTFFQADGQTDGSIDLSLGFGTASETTLTGSLNANRITIKSNGQLLFGDADNSHTTRISHSTDANNRTITFPDADGTILLKDNVNPGKQFQVFQANFVDDIGTSEVFIPLHGTTFEQSTVYQDDVAILAPCDGRIVSLDLNIFTIIGTNADVTINIYTLGPNSTGTSLSSWTNEESETINITSTDDSHVFHFAFDNAKHFESTEKFALSIQASSDITSNTIIYASAVVEFDYSTLLPATSAEFDSVP